MREIVGGGERVRVEKRERKRQKSNLLENEKKEETIQTIKLTMQEMINVLLEVFKNTSINYNPFVTYNR